MSKRAADIVEMESCKKIRSCVQRESPFSQQLLHDPHMKHALTQQYATAPVYPHILLRNILQPIRFTKLYDEIFDQLAFTFKETDLFKLYQSIDLANLDPQKHSHLPELLALRDALASEEFRLFISELTGCGELIDRVDCAVNNYAQGSHLLCHDDVIGNRKISYIIYLTDDREEWKPEFGGSLELYRVHESGDVSPVPEVEVLPFANSMGIFEVVPGKSLHSVREVFADNRPRISIQGWFHAHSPPDGKELASLNQLQRMNQQEEKKDFGEYSLEPLEREDMEIIQEFVNEEYLKDNNWEMITEKFREDSSIVLHNFIKPEKVDEFHQLMMSFDEEQGLGKGRIPDYMAGVGRGWAYRGPPHKQRNLVFSDLDQQYSDYCPIGVKMSQMRAFLVSDAFSKLLSQLTSLCITGCRESTVRRFRPGIDYTVGHYGLLTDSPRLDVTLCFAEDSNLWLDGDCGGFQCYIEADEDYDDEAAESYQWDEEGDDDDDNRLFSTPAHNNSLTIVLRDEGVMQFIKYLSNRAPSSRWDVSVEYELHPESFE